MSAINAVETSILLLIFNATAWADFAEDDSSSPLTEFYISLHTSDPGESGAQTTNETNYTSYARVSVARTSGGFTVSAGNVSNAALVTFIQCTGGSSDVTHFGIGKDSSGAGTLYFRGTLDSTLSVSNGITPEFAIGALDVDLD